MPSMIFLTSPGNSISSCIPPDLFGGANVQSLCRRRAVKFFVCHRLPSALSEDLFSVAVFFGAPVVLFWPPAGFLEPGATLAYG